MNPELAKYNEKQDPNHREVCNLLAQEIDRNLPGAESKIWHAHSVWFLDGNPIVGHCKQKPGIRLTFWSGADFGDVGLDVRGGKFKDASVFFNHVSEVRTSDLRQWVKKE
jgi:hypothetical protein